MIQAAAEHAALVRDLFTEYLQFLSDMDLRTFGRGFDVASVVESDLLELKKLAPPMGRLLLVFAEKDVAGIGGFRTIRPGVGEVKRFYVRPNFRRRGLARCLIEQLIEDAREMQFHTLKLDAAPYSQSAKDLYRSAGFVKCDQYPESEAPKDFLDEWEFFERKLN